MPFRPSPAILKGNCLKMITGCVKFPSKSRKQFDSSVCVGQRAKSCGYPEQFGQQASGRNSTAVHRAYVKHAEVTVPSLADWEKDWQENPQRIVQPKLLALTNLRFPQLGVMPEMLLSELDQQHYPILAKRELGIDRENLYESGGISAGNAARIQYSREFQFQLRTRAAISSS